MSSEWEERGQHQQPEDAYTRMWQDVDEQWDFDHIPQDWTVWDEPPGADRSLDPYDPVYGDASSETIDQLTPPRPSRDLGGGHEQRRRTLHDPLTFTSLPPIDNNPYPAAPYNPPPPHPEQTSTRQTQQAPNQPRRAPVIDHSEDWLDRTAPRRAAAQETTYDFIPDHLFETVSESSEGIETEIIDYNMPPTTRGRAQRGSVVDLTADASSPREQPARAPRSLKRAAAEDAAATGEGRSSTTTAKRSKKSSATQQPIDELDLTNENPSAEEELLRAQQEDTIITQQQQAEQDTPAGPQKIGARQCIICMENYTNATVTHCGHIYCHECLTQALIAGEKNSERGVGNCPVCRKPINRKKAGQIIPVAFMKKQNWGVKGKEKGRKGEGGLLG